MNYVSTQILTTLQKQQIIDLWNESYPAAIRHENLESFDNYLAKLTGHNHILLLDKQDVVKAWFFDFIRENDRWFAMIVSPELQGKGIGSRLLYLGKAFSEELNGWTVYDTAYKKANGQPYRSPVEFYIKNGFQIHPEIVWETPVMNSIKITWKRATHMDNRKITIRQTSDSDLQDILEINRRAFGEEDVASLVEGLLKDATAQPLLSLLAFVDGKPVGYILFTRATLEGQTDQPKIQILAPLAVLPEFQKQKIGGKLITEGISQLRKSGTKLVFVLGHETYYPRHGFIPDAKSFGFPATYPIPEKNKDAWMIYPLVRNALNGKTGKVICADFMNNPEYWHE